ncbi:MAG: Asp-tRNA(Asn)/Glu-tRNA(Gln) amidotransferase subunit GatC [Patescibacteria group bacterium]
MASPINQKVLKHLAGLARIELSEREEKKLLDDLRSILAYFEKLEEVDTTDVPAMNGGTTLQNIFREDSERIDTQKQHGVESFPEEVGGFLKVPSVFNHDSR